MWPWSKTREWLQKAVRKIFKKAGVAYGRPHGGLFHKFRRTSGSLVEAAGGDGARHLGNTRAVFEQHYRDPRICVADAPMILPRPPATTPPALPIPAAEDRRTGPVKALDAADRREVTAQALARAGVTLEQVAELLWGGPCRES